MESAGGCFPLVWLLRTGYSPTVERSVQALFCKRSLSIVIIWLGPKGDILLFRFFSRTKYTHKLESSPTKVDIMLKKI